jgi:hypothetical protein
VRLIWAPPVQKRPAHRRRSTRIDGELRGPSDRLVQQVVNVGSATRWEGYALLRCSCAPPAPGAATPPSPTACRNPATPPADPLGWPDQHGPVVGGLPAATLRPSADAALKMAVPRLHGPPMSLAEIARTRLNQAVHLAVW